MTHDGHIATWIETIYEPEVHAFGGPEAMRLAHRLFHTDSRCILGCLGDVRATTSGQRDRRRELSVLLCSALMRSARQDWYEQGDVWARVAEARPLPVDTPIDRLRTRMARPDQGSSAWSYDVWADRATPSIDPADALTAERDAERVSEALRELPLTQRLAIELSYFEGLTQSQIAERLEQPLGTVKTRIRLGLLKLRDALSGSSPEGAA